MSISDAFGFIRNVQEEAPKISAVPVNLLMADYGLSEYHARVIAADQQTAQFFIEVAALNKDYKAISNWVMGPVRNLLKQNTETRISPEQLAQLINLINEGKISYTLAVQKIFPKLTEDPSFMPLKIAEENGWILMNDDTELIRIIRDIIRIYPLKVEEYKNGKKGILAMFMGEVMKRTKGKADPRRASDYFLNEIEKHN